MIDNQKLKNKVKELCSDERFVHHKWFYKDHLEIVEKIVNELLFFYPSADKQLMESLIWYHDLEKILRNQNQNAEDVLIQCGFSREEIERLNEIINTESRHRELDLNNTDIEVKILASADGAAHFIGPFFSIYWYENPDKSIEDLTKGDLEKIKRDWERKIVLPEVKKYFELRHQYILEQRGVYPEKFLS